MAAFEYVALDPHGKRTRGVVAADTARAARRELRQRRLTLLKLDESQAAQRSLKGAEEGGRSGLTPAERVLVTRQLAMLIQSGAPVEEALNAVAQQATRRPARRALLELRSEVTEGRRLSEAAGRQGRTFGSLFRPMAAAGEATGELGAVLSRLADLEERAQKVRQKTLAAVIYPIVLTIVATVIVTALMTFVVPRVVEQFDTLDQDLPLLTDVVIFISNGFRTYGLLIALAAAAGVLAFARALRLEPVRAAADALVLWLPVVGGFVRVASAARFARTFGSLLQSRVPVLESIEAAKLTVQNRVVRKAAERVAEAVRKGGSVAAAMRAEKAFPPLLVFMAASGERGGELGAMFEKAADYLEGEMETTTEVALNLLEPLIIVVMGAIVALIVLSIMLPILRLNALALT
ncbi:MAG: type II secretion system inner membrane protein GspF [Maricaulaceae bacterium]|jgi:general secretion pathway protein F